MSLLQCREEVKYYKEDVGRCTDIIEHGTECSVLRQIQYLYSMRETQGSRDLREAASHRVSVQAPYQETRCNF